MPQGENCTKDSCYYGSETNKSQTVPKQFVLVLAVGVN
jgi:hypothetical protein